MRTLAIYALAATLVAGLLAVHDSRLQRRVTTLEQQLAPAGRPVSSEAARREVKQTDVERAELGYQESKRFADDIVYSACRSEGGSRASCAKQMSK